MTAIQGLIIPGRVSTPPAKRHLPIPNIYYSIRTSLIYSNLVVSRRVVTSFHWLIPIILVSCHLEYHVKFTFSVPHVITSVRSTQTNTDVLIGSEIIPTSCFHVDRHSAKPAAAAAAAPTTRTATSTTTAAATACVLCSGLSVVSSTQQRHEFSQCLASLSEPTLGERFERTTCRGDPRTGRTASRTGDARSIQQAGQPFVPTAQS